MIDAGQDRAIGASRSPSKREASAGTPPAEVRRKEGQETMGRFEKILQSTSGVSVCIGVIFMLAVGFITVVNVICRFTGVAMTGYLEAIEVMMIVASLGAMTIAVFEKMQVAIDILIGRLSPRSRGVLEIAGVSASFLFWVAISYATISWVCSGAFREQTDILKIPMLPFEIFWVLGLIFVCLVYLSQLMALRRKSGVK